MADDELATMDDPEFLAERRRVREELERTPVASPALTARYAALTARRFNAHGNGGYSHPSGARGPNGSRRILLADPEALDDDVLESCLYILREKLRAA